MMNMLLKSFKDKICLLLFKSFWEVKQSELQWIICIVNSKFSFSSIENNVLKMRMLCLAMAFLSISTHSHWNLLWYLTTTKAFVKAIKGFLLFALAMKWLWQVFYGKWKHIKSFFFQIRYKKLQLILLLLFF